LRCLMDEHRLPMSITQVTRLHRVCNKLHTLLASFPSPVSLTQFTSRFLSLRIAKKPTTTIKAAT